MGFAMVLRPPMFFIAFDSLPDTIEDPISSISPKAHCPTRLIFVCLLCALQLFLILGFAISKLEYTGMDIHTRNDLIPRHNNMFISSTNPFFTQPLIIMQMSTIVWNHWQRNMFLSTSLSSRHPPHVVIKSVLYNGL